MLLLFEDQIHVDSIRQGSRGRGPEKLRIILADNLGPRRRGHAVAPREPSRAFCGVAAVVAHVLAAVRYAPHVHVTCFSQCSDW